MTPALSSFLLPDQVRETDTVVVRFLHRIYRPILRFAFANRIITLGGAALMVLLTIIVINALGLEFLPKLEEGNLWIRATMPTSVSLEASDDFVNGMRKLMRSYPEVQTVVSQHGRPDDGTDATGFFNAEFFVPLKPASEWPKDVDKDSLTQDMSAALQDRFPGVDFNFSQYIEDNVEEAASGVKGENSVKLFGNDLATLEKTADRIKTVMATVPGITDLAVFSSLGQPTIRIDIDRARAASYGLAPGDVNATVQAAIGGQAAGNLYKEGSDRNFPIIVRLAPEYRQSVDAIRRITIGAPNPSGSGVVQIPLTDVANVRLVSGAAFIYRENQERYGTSVVAGPGVAGTMTVVGSGAASQSSIVQPASRSMRRQGIAHHVVARFLPHMVQSASCGPRHRAYLLISDGQCFTVVEGRAAKFYPL